MAIDQLLEALERDARAEADRVLAEARGDAEALAARTDALIAERRSRLLGERESRQETDLQVELAAARLAARREVLAAREALLDRVFLAMRSACMAAVTDADYHETIASRLERAVACFAPGARLTVAASAPLVPVILRWPGLPRGTTVEAGLPSGTGFRVAAVDGTVEVLDTLEAPLGSDRAGLARRALALLGVSS